MTDVSHVVLILVKRIQATFALRTPPCRCAGLHQVITAGSYPEKMGQQLKLHGKNVLIPVIRIQATFALRIPCHNPGNIPIIREPASAKIPGKNISVLTVCICSGPERCGLLTLIHERTLSRADWAHLSVLRTMHNWSPPSKSLKQAKKKWPT